MSHFIYETDFTQHLLEKPHFCLLYDFKPSINQTDVGLHLGQLTGDVAYMNDSSL